MCWGPSRHLRSLSCSPVLAFANFNKPFLIETDVSKLGLAAVLSQKQADGQYHWIAYVSQSITAHEYNYHSIKPEFLAVKLVIAEQFQEYLLWKPFIFKTNHNLLTYTIMSPNLDATQHHWIE